jgi:hypothetical protein
MPPLPDELRALLGPIASGILLFALGAVGIAWLSIAAVEAAAAMLGAVWGPAAVGAAMLAPLGIAGLLARAKARRIATQQARGLESADASLAAIASATQKMIEKSPIAALALATLAGLLATRYPAGLSLLANVLTANERA